MDLCKLGHKKGFFLWPRPSEVQWRNGNIDAAPRFVEPGNGDYHLKSVVGRWDPNIEGWVTDAVTSPCIDAGNPGCPLGDEPNDANNIRINVGAYGGTAEASKSHSIDYRLLIPSTLLRTGIDYLVDIASRCLSF